MKHLLSHFLTKFSTINFTVLHWKYDSVTNFDEMDLTYFTKVLQNSVHCASVSEVSPFNLLLLHCENQSNFNDKIENNRGNVIYLTPNLTKEMTTSFYVNCQIKAGDKDDTIRYNLEKYITVM